MKPFTSADVAKSVKVLSGPHAGMFGRIARPEIEGRVLVLINGYTISVHRANLERGEHVTKWEPETE